MIPYKDQPLLRPSAALLGGSGVAVDGTHPVAALLGFWGCFVEFCYGLAAIAPPTTSKGALLNTEKNY